MRISQHVFQEWVDIGNLSRVRVQEDYAVLGRLEEAPVTKLGNPPLLTRAHAPSGPTVHFFRPPFRAGTLLNERNQIMCRDSLWNYYLVLIGKNSV